MKREAGSLGLDSTLTGPYELESQSHDQNFSLGPARMGQSGSILYRKRQWPTVPSKRSGELMAVMENAALGVRDFRKPGIKMSGSFSAKPSPPLRRPKNENPGSLSNWPLPLITVRFLCVLPSRRRRSIFRKNSMMVAHCHYPAHAPPVFSRRPMWKIGAPTQKKKIVQGDPRLLENRMDLLELVDHSLESVTCWVFDIRWGRIFIHWRPAIMDRSTEAATWIN